MLAARTGAKLRFVPLTKDGTELDMAVHLQLFCIATWWLLLHCLPLSLANVTPCRND